MNWIHPDDPFLLPPMEKVTDFFLGLDLAQSNEFTALAVVERTVLPGQGYATRYSCRDLRRWPIGTRYPQIVLDLRELVATLSPTGLPPLYGARLVVDITGVGRSVVDMFQCVPYSLDRFTRVFIATGHGATFDRSHRAWQVARKELVGVLQTLLQTGRLKIAQSLPEAELLTKELQTFREKITLAGIDPMESWRDRDHDDLVLALAVALWYAERYPLPPPLDPRIGEPLTPGLEPW